MTFQKQEIIDDLKTALGKSSQWRLRTDAAWPGDHRNSAAAQMLEALALSAADLSDDDWHALNPHFGQKSSKWRDAVSLAARQVAITRHPRTISQFVRNLAGILNEQTVAQS